MPAQTIYMNMLSQKSVTRGYAVKLIYSETDLIHYKLTLPTYCLQ
jgi:hypothetical protein